jgi:hypothetical protein
VYCRLIYMDKIRRNRILANLLWERLPAKTIFQNSHLIWKNWCVLYTYPVKLPTFRTSLPVVKIYRNHIILMRLRLRNGKMIRLRLPPIFNGFLSAKEKKIKFWCVSCLQQGKWCISGSATRKIMQCLLFNSYLKFILQTTANNDDP